VNVRIDLRCPLATEDVREVVGSASLVLSLPRGSSNLTPAVLFAAVQELMVFALTSSDNQAANTAVTVDNARFDRLIAGEG
jgi:hypothetical protein